MYTPVCPCRPTDQLNPARCPSLPPAPQNTTAHRTVHTAARHTVTSHTAATDTDDTNTAEPPSTTSKLQTSEVNVLMMYREIIAVCSQIHTKHINTAVWAERRIVNVKLAVNIVATVRYIW